MPHRKIGQLSAWRPLLMGTALLLVALHAVPAEARTRRRQRPNAFQVALQPFKLARSVVHAVADPIVEPIVHQAPRAALALATAPLRAARASREVVRGEQVSEDEIETAAEPARGRAVRVAYMVPHGPRELPPPDESDDAVADEPLREFDQEEEDATRAAPAPMTSGNRPTVAGRRAVLRNGIAYAPSEAPARVKNAIWAANTLRRKPYLWGGGHGSFYDRGYDCSGTVSFALHGAGLLGAPLPSSDLMGYGERGRGRWFTIYVRPGHTFAVIAGLRLDTTDFQNGGNTGPRWHADMRDTRGYVVRHPAGM